MTTSDTFSVRTVRALVADCFEPRPLVYWLDFGLSWTLGVAAFLACGTGVVPLVPGLVVAAMALYRAAVFIHEIVHCGRRRALRGFGAVWNVLCGVPLLIPTFLYRPHLDHHSRVLYASDDDLEYVPFALRRARHIVLFLLSSPLVPLAGVLRFAVLTPVAWLVPPARELVDRRASSLRIDFEHDGREPPPRERGPQRVQEAACFAYVVAVTTLVVLGVLEWRWVLLWYAALCVIVVVNSLRLLAAHRYATGGDTDVVGQLLDSVNHPRHRLLSELWAPVGLRLHALHHLFPMMPYHELPQAHRRLVAALPPDSAYRQAESPGLVASLRLLWRRARTSP